MLSFFAPKRPEDVFTPRSALVNKTMYVSRPEYESELIRCIRSGYHIVIFGDSGCGKSWLYKKVFDDQRIEYTTLDLSSAKSADEVELLFLEACDSGEWREEQRVEERTRSIMPHDVGVKQTGTATFVRQDDPAFYQLCSAVRKKAGSKKAFVVLENLEHSIANSEIVNLLRSILLALDDKKLASLNVHICMVGVPSDIKTVLSDGDKFQTIANRVAEISEVQRMSKDQARLLILQGFRNELGLDLESSEYCVSQIIYLTDRIPQYLQDVCLQVAFVAEEKGGIVSPGVVAEGAHNWVETNARQSRDFIETLLGKVRRRKDSKSRVIFAISKCETTDFYANDISEIIKNLLPISCSKHRIRVSTVLDGLCNGQSRLLKKDSSTLKYRIATPKLRSVLRHCLKLDPTDEAILMTGSE